MNKPKQVNTKQVNTKQVNTKQVNTKQVNTKQKTDIYDVNKYSTKELYGILDLNNPTDRELEAKIIFYINKYDNVNPSLYKFFNDIYGHFFEVDDEYKEDHEGFTNIVEGFNISSSGLDSSVETGLEYLVNPTNSNPTNSVFKSSENAVYDTTYTNTNPRPKPGSTDVSFNVGTQDLATKGSTSIGYTTNFNFPKGNLNPLLKETIKRIISIDSQYRDYSTFPLSTFFTFNLSDTLTDVVSLKLYSVQIPYTWYTINNNFGSNFFYIKGISPGIDDENSNYKFTIPSGNHSAPGLIAEINKSITSQANSLIEVDLSDTSIVYTQGNAKCTFNINIIKRYNDINYFLYFPSWTNPGNNIETDTNSRFYSIPGFLGLLGSSHNTLINTDSIYSTYTIFSNSSIIEPSTTQTILLNSTNNSFNIIFYKNDTDNSYNPSTNSPITSMLNPSITINLLNITASSSQTPASARYQLSSILQFINNGFAAIPILNGSTITLDQYTINNVGEPPINTIYYRYKINIKLNRKLLSFYDGMKAIIQFPNDQNLWLFSTSALNFKAINNELNDIISEVNTPVTSFAISNSPYIYLKCNAEYYGYNPIQTCRIDNIIADICGNPIIQIPTGPTGSTWLQNNTYTNTNSKPNTIHIIPSNSNPYYIGMGNYTITNDNVVIVNKTINVQTGNINISGPTLNHNALNGNSYTVYGQNYNVSGNALINGEVNVIASPLASNIASTSTYTINSINSHRYMITESILNGNINMQSIATIYGNVSISKVDPTGSNVDPMGITITGSNYSLIGNTQINGMISITGASQLLNNSIQSRNTIDGPNYDISGNSFISGTTYSGNIIILSGNAFINSTTPYTIYGETIYEQKRNIENFIITGNTNITGDIYLSGNINIYNLNNANISISSSLLPIISSITSDSNFDNNFSTNDYIYYICSGNISINTNIAISSSAPNYSITNNATDYMISGQDRINNIANSIIVNGNAIINSGNVLVTTIDSNTPYTISQPDINQYYLLNGNIKIFGNATVIQANITINSTGSYTINGTSPYTLIGNTLISSTRQTIQIVDKVKIQTDYANSYSVNSAAGYLINGNATISGLSTILGNVNITSTTAYTITGQNYSIQTPTNLQGNIVIFRGNLLVSSKLLTAGLPYIITGNNYNTTYTAGDNTIQGNTYIITGNTTISGNTYSVYGNANIRQDTSFNDYIINIPNSPTYLLDDYKTAINNAFITCITDNSSLSSGGSSMTIDTNNSNLHSSMKFNTQSLIGSANYSIDLSQCYLHTKMGFLSTILGDTSVSTPISSSTFNINTQGYEIDNSNNLIRVYSTGNQNRNVPPISLIIPIKTYPTFNELTDAINLLFTLNVGQFINMRGTQLQYTINSNSTISLTFTLKISCLLDENTYSVYFYDNDLIKNHYSNVDISGFYGPITTNWLADTSTNTWSRYLDIQNQNYDLYIITDQNNLSYGEISGNDTIQSNSITLTDQTNFFYLKPLPDPLGGVYTTTPNSDNTGQYNDILFVIPEGTYSKELLKTYINNAFNSDPRTAGSTLSFIIDPITFHQYTKIRLNVKTNFTAQDFILDFYDPISFTTCNMGLSGKSSIQNVLWDETLGWILGFRNTTQYYLTPANQTLNKNTEKTYYNQFPSTPYSYDSSGAHITGDTCVSVFLYNYFMIILDDYVQNHLNDGLVTITNTDFNIPLPSYANRATFICDPITHKPVATATTTNYNSLTQKQVYAANEILNVQQTNQSNYSSGPFIQDIFGLIPIKTSGMQNGQPYIEFGGSLQLQERTYFGPVNIRRMTIKLVNDKGNVVDLNGANWSFSLVCEQLYSSNTSK